MLTERWELLYLPITGDLLPFMVFVLSHGFLGMSGRTKQKYSSNMKTKLLLPDDMKFSYSVM